MKAYIGDSVYITIDALGVELTTENGLPTDPSNKIYLEWQVYLTMMKLVDEVFAEHARHSKKPRDDDKKK